MKRGLMGTMVILMVFFTALVSTALAVEKLAKKQVLTIAFDAGDVKTLDPHSAAATADRAVVDMMFNGLVRYPPGNQVGFEPDLAESWKVSEDGKLWTFNLRKGVFFHPFPGSPDGYEMTSEDVVYSLKRAATAQTSAYAGEYTGLDFKATAPNTVEISVEKPMSETLFLAKVANYAGGFIVCRKAIEAQGNDWFKMHPVGTGPFVFKTYEPQQSVTLVQNGKYFRGKPVLEQVVARFMPSVSSREFGLRTGELDIIEGLKEEQWVEKIASFPQVSVKIFGPCEVQMLNFNLTKKPFDDIRVRKAFCYAVSREDVAAFMGKSLAVPIYSAALAPPAPGALTREMADKAGVVYENNIEKAKQLLAEAGYPKGFETEVIISEMDSSYRKPMIAIQAQVKKAGIDMKLKVVEHSSFHSLIRQDASPLVYYASWRPNVDVFLTRFYHSDSALVSGKKPDTNFSHYGAVDANGDGKIDNIDAVIENARWELDSKRQNQLWEEAQLQLLKDVAVLPVIRLQYDFPMKSYVDLGNPLDWSWQTYAPQITEKTRILEH
jgi:peptide/nickel transport system substrate-binding protein